MSEIKAKRSYTKRGGVTMNSLYGTWDNMIARCYDQTRRSYRWYGAKGVTVCQIWRESFADFLLDMGPRPKGYTLDRRDPCGNYEPSNCRWADKKTQAANKRPKPRKKNPRSWVKDFNSSLARAKIAVKAELTPQKNVPLSLEILHSHRESLLAFALSLRVSREDAEDLAQETLLKGWLARDQFDTGTNLKAWLFTILRNQRYSNLRKERRLEHMEPEELTLLMTRESMTVKCRGADSFDAEVIAMRAQSLPEHYKTVLEIFANGRDYLEGAGELGICFGTFKSRLSRARALLKEGLEASAEA